MSDKETLFKKFGFVINEGGLVDFCDGKGGRSSPHPAEAKKLWELLAVECRAPAPQPAELELEQETDGRWLAEFTRFPGAMAYGPSKEEAIRNAAKVLIEDGEVERG